MCNSLSVEQKVSFHYEYQASNDYIIIWSEKAFTKQLVPYAVLLRYVNIPELFAQ